MNNIVYLCSQKSNNKMKRTSLLLTGLLMAIAMQAANVTDTIVVRIKGMRCEECAHKVNTVLRKLNGVKSIDYNLERRTATIAYDQQLTCRDTIEARLAATGRYKASNYSKDNVIRRGMGLRMDDMHCQKCADRITKRLEQIEGVDSMAPKVDKQYVFVRYDANRTTKDIIRQALTDLGFTPVNYYTAPPPSRLLPTFRVLQYCPTATVPSMTCWGAASLNL